MAKGTAVLGDTLSIIPDRENPEYYSAARILRYIIDGEQHKEYVEVGRSSEHGYQEENVKKIAQSIIEFLSEKGYRVIPSESLPLLSEFTAEESTVLNTTFEIEEKEIIDEQHSGLSETS